jgi:tetratricopeptide (TPR) repeat protein
LLLTGHYRQAIEISPSDPRALFSLGRVKFELREYRRAQVYFTDTIKVIEKGSAVDRPTALTQNLAHSYLKRGEALFKLREYQTCIGDLDKAEEISSEGTYMGQVTAEAVKMRAYAYERLGDASRAKADHEKAARMVTEYNSRNPQ